MSKEEKIELFSNEISWIKDSKLKSFAKELIGNADDYFFRVPASSSGKYHPSFDLGNGGLVRHTRCVAFFARTMAESLDFDEHDTDLIIIAAIAHDIKKQGNGTGYTVRQHPLLAADYVVGINEANSNILTEEDIKKVCGAVRSHMGKWEAKRPWAKGELFPMPETEFEKALQAADYVASRKEILDFNFGEGMTKTAPIEEKPKTVSNDPKDYVINFGKHKGKTLEEIKSTGYLEWMVKQEDFFCKEAQDMAKLYLNPKKNLEEEKTVDIPTDDDIVDDLPF